MQLRILLLAIFIGNVLAQSGPTEDIPDSTIEPLPKQDNEREKEYCNYCENDKNDNEAKICVNINIKKLKEIKNMILNVPLNYLEMKINFVKYCLNLIKDVFNLNTIQQIIEFKKKIPNIVRDIIEMIGKQIVEIPNDINTIKDKIPGVSNILNMIGEQPLGIKKPIKESLNTIGGNIKFPLTG